MDISKQLFVILLFAFCHHFASTDGARIGVFTLVGSPSHKETMYGIIEGLVERGHSVTYYTAFDKPKKDIKGITEIHLRELENAKDDMSFFDESGKIDMGPFMVKFTEMTMDRCKKIVTIPEMRKLIESKEKVFDVSLVDILYQECAFPVLHKASKATIVVSTGDLTTYWKWMYNVPEPFAISPSIMNSHPSYRMTFCERIQNAFANLFSVKMHSDLMNRFDEIVAQHAPGLIPIWEATRQISLVFTSSHPAIFPSLPTSPMVKQLGGVSLNDKKNPMDKDLQEFIEGSGDAGFIFVSFGSIVPAQAMPMHAKKAFFEAFAKLPQRVVWRFENVDNWPIPPNVKLVKWVPQITILAHPKIRLFVMHGGINGYMETVNYGVPVVVIPVFADQPLNARNMVDDGIGEMLDWPSLSGSSVLETINQVIRVPSYKQNVQRVQKIFQDRLVSPKAEAAYWVEYVVRHNGSNHLRIKADHLNLFQYLLLDVFALVGGILAVAAYVAYRILKAVLCCLVGGGKKKDVNKSKKRN